jgi:hypothetical protein
MSLFTTSPWEYDTSQESSVSIAVGTGGIGTLYFVNSETGETMQVPYSYAGLGGGAGAPANFAQSTAENPSAGSVQVLPWGTFDATIFPCTGQLIAISATAGIFQPSFFPNSGACACIFAFGMLPPQAYLLAIGEFNSALPSAGVSQCVVTFQEATSYAGAGDTTNDTTGSGADDSGGGGSSDGAAATG